jgi:hypothetical protein
MVKRLKMLALHGIVNVQVVRLYFCDHLSQQWRHQFIVEVGVSEIIDCIQVKIILWAVQETISLLKAEGGIGYACQSQKYPVI